MVSVLRYTLSNVKVEGAKVTLSYALTFINQEIASDLHSVKVSTRASCSYVHPPSHAVPLLTIWLGSTDIYNLVCITCMDKIILHGIDPLEN